MSLSKNNNKEVLEAIGELREDINSKLDQMFKATKEGFQIVNKRLDGINTRLKQKEEEKVA